MDIEENFCRFWLPWIQEHKPLDDMVFSSGSDTQLPRLQQQYVENMTLESGLHPANRHGL